MADEKQLRKQAEINYKKVQGENRLLVKENDRLQSVGQDLVKANEEIKVEKEKNSIAQKQYSELLKKTQGLEKEAANYSDPKELKEELKESKTLISGKDTEIQELQKNVSVLQKKNQELISTDDRSAEAMQQIKEKDDEVKHLENELEAAKKKIAKNEGEFPKLPTPSILLAEVIMESGKKMGAYLIERKNQVPMLVQVCTQDGKAVSVDFKKA